MSDALSYFLGLWFIVMVLCLMVIRAKELGRNARRERVTPLEDDRRFQ